MKISDQYKVRHMAGLDVVIEQGRYGEDMTRVITLNQTSLFLWNELKDKDFTVDDVVSTLRGAYEVDEDTAARDAEAWCRKMKECGLVSGD